MNIKEFLTRTRYPGRIHITDILSWIWLAFGTLMVIIPLGWALMSSFKPESEIMKFPPSFLPMAAYTMEVEGYDDPLEVWELTREDGSTQELGLVRRLGRMGIMVDPENPGERLNINMEEMTQAKELHFAWDNYLVPLQQFNFFRYFQNTIFVTVISTLTTLLVASMIAFALSKYHFRGKNTLLTIVLATMMIPATVTMVPAYLIVYALNLTDSLWGLILTSTGSTTGIFLLRQYMLTIPDELVEAARIDAASEFRIYWKIMLPLTAPALAVLAIFTIMGRWNEFLWPMLILSSSENFTLQVALNAFKGEFSVQWHYILAMTMLSLAPLTIAFGFLQKHITSGIANTGIK